MARGSEVEAIVVVGEAVRIECIVEPRLKRRVVVLLTGASFRLLQGDVGSSSAESGPDHLPNLSSPLPPRQDEWPVVAMDMVLRAEMAVTTTTTTTQ